MFSDKFSMAIQYEGKSLYEAIGGRPTLEKVHKIFYDKIYADAWIGLFFKDIKQKIIEDQQTDFMSDLMGGPKNYCGKFPQPAHKHMYITEELFEYRHKLLRESLLEANVSEQLAQAWIKLDGAFKKAIVKQSVQDCESRYKGEEILVFDNPQKKSA